MKLKIFTFVTGLLIALCAQAQTSGPTGPLTWSYDAGTKTLSITGTGDMPDYSDTSPQPWEAYRNNALTVTIGEGVTRIGNDAFVGFISLQNITLPTSLSSIGSYAFLDCSALQNIALNEGITTIEKRAFESCTALQSITLPASVTSIGNSPFLSCKSIKNINVSPSNMQYASQDGILYNKAMTELLRYPPGKSGMTFSVPVQVSTVGEFAFEYCTELQSLTFPESVTFIGFLAFDQCTALTTINVDGSNTHYTSIDGILYNKAKTQILCYPSRKSGTAFVVPDGITFIGNKAFANNTALQSINLPSSLTSIGYMAFHDCVELKSILLPASIQSFGQWTFSRCTALKEISVMWDTPLPVDPSIFSGVPLSAATLKVPAGKKALYQAASVWKDFGTITDGTTILPSGDYDFTQGGLFYKKLSSTEVSVCSQKANAPYYEDAAQPTGTITIPTTITEGGVIYNVTEIGETAFIRCSNLTSISIPSSVTTIGDITFNGCTALINIGVDETNMVYTSEEGILYNKSKTTLIRCPSAKKGTLNIPISVKTISDYALLDCSHLTSVSLPDGLTTIGHRSFLSCGNLTSISFPESVKKIGNEAFKQCNSLTSINFPSNLSTVGEFAFSNCINLKAITFSTSITSILQYAFEACIALEEVTVEWNTPLAINPNTFTSVPLSAATLKVPAGKKALYQAAPVWKDFGTITESSVTPGTAELTVTPGTARMMQVADDLYLSIQSNTDWTATSSEEWLTLSPSSGTKNGTVKATTTTNNDSQDRTATVTVKAGNQTRTVTITQKGRKAPSSVDLNISEVQLMVGAQIQLSDTVRPWDEDVDREVIWSSSNTRVATVDDTGLVRAVGEGEAVITVQTEIGGFKATCNVTVSKQDAIVIPPPPASPVPDTDKKNVVTLSLTVPTDQGFTLSFVLNLPKGLVLDQEKTKLAESLIDQYTLTITPEGNGWKFEIKLNMLRKAADHFVVREMVHVAYTADPSVEKGNYDAQIKKLHLTFTDGSTLAKNEIPFKITVHTTTSNELIEANMQVWTAGGRLYVTSPVREMVEVYTFGGKLVFRTVKPSGEAVYDLVMPEGAAIVRGSSGWTKKVKK